MTSQQILDRAAGTLVGAACGDALGVPYEFGSSPFDARRGPESIGGGLGSYAPGEWSDDTQMAVCIARVAASGIPIDSPEGLDQIARGFLTWMDFDPADVGIQTRSLLTPMLAGDRGDGIAERMAAGARDLHDRTGRTAGNGALMRTAPVALAFLEDRERTATAARRIAELTHTDPLAGDSCVLWCEAIRASVVAGDPTGPEAGLDLLPAERRSHWEALADGSWREGGAAGLRPNGFTVTALYAALHAVEAAEGSFRDGIAAAVALGDDTDTVAAIAGALLGAQLGTGAIPQPWRSVVHGWPDMETEDLTRMAGEILRD